MQVNKTDSNDALGPTQIVRTGWYREVTVKGWQAHRVRGLIGAPARLVEVQRTLANPAVLNAAESRLHRGAGLEVR